MCLSTFNCSKVVSYILSATRSSKPRIGGKMEWKEVATNDPIYLKGDTGDFELYGIRLVKPYNDKIKTEMKIVPL